ncbi:PQQ-binding-like beta-propeller repeat protein [Serratia proteamaculans]|uniref:PQQ-binding-like beta-propeller repeat protein n=1 Tax=Serratia proteamaculans TaxID=28151 RepID=A0A5Q2VF23_SERPR|nr:PQQ-binding-like beta-propeller repeat protein [Serratia proteamaculans]QGH61983.1 PQQ-binding-like beta-propeller repeat protein [Serratia proteamaculans]
MITSKLLPLAAFTSAVLFSASGFASTLEGALWEYGDNASDSVKEGRLHSSVSIDKKGRMYTVVKKGDQVGLGVFATSHEEMKWFIPFSERDGFDYSTTAPVIDDVNDRIFVIMGFGLVMSFDISGEGEPKQLNTNVNRDIMKVLSVALPGSGNLVMTACTTKQTGGNQYESKLYQFDHDLNMVDEQKVGDVPALNCARTDNNLFHTVVTEPDLIISDAAIKGSFQYQPSTHQQSPWGKITDAPYSVDSEGNKYFINWGAVYRETTQGAKEKVWEAQWPDGVSDPEAKRSVSSIMLSGDMLLVNFRDTYNTKQFISAVSIRANNPQQQPLWTTKIDNEYVSLHSVTANGTLYVTTARHLYALNTQDGGRLALDKVSPAGHVFTDVLPDKNGRLWVSYCATEPVTGSDTRSCKVAVIEGDGTPIASGSSSLRSDLANTGRLYTQHYSANAISGIAVNDYKFDVKDKFPTTGFKGAQFTLELTNGSASDYTWTANPDWVSVRDGVVTLTGSAYSGAPVTVSAAPKSGLGERLYYSFRLSSWFINSGATFWDQAEIDCNSHKKPDFRLPLRTELSNVNATRGQMGALWSEWGDMSHYPSSGFGASHYWTSEAMAPSDTSWPGKHYVAHLGYGNIHGSDKDYESKSVVCRTSL